MSEQKHHLSEKGFNKICPVQSGYVKQCDSNCAWFDHEVQDCRMIVGITKVTEAINYLREVV